MVRNMSTKYLLDTSVLIQAQQSYYAFDIAPVFWKHLDDQSQRGTIRSIDKVRNEIRFFNNSLGNWAKNKFKRWESTDNEYTKQRHRKLIEWSTSSTHYNQRAKNLFADMSKADAWLIAHAWANQYTVVTQEGRDDVTVSLFEAVWVIQGTHAMTPHGPNWLAASRPMERLHEIKKN